MHNDGMIYLNGQNICKISPVEIYFFKNYSTQIYMHHAPTNLQSITEV